MALLPHIEQVKIVEVGPRDGLQNEKIIVPPDVIIDFVNQLSETGLSMIEVTSFVSSKWVPQMADAEQVFKRINKKRGVHYSALIPNVQGLETALLAGVNEIAVFTTPSEKFSQANTHCSVSESIARITDVVQRAKTEKLRVRAYISCVLGCPYEGVIAPDAILQLAEKLLILGCDEISLGDTIGIGTPGSTKTLLDIVAKEIPAEKLAVHFHDTYGQALVNIYVALHYGIRVIDAAVSGLGGCPYAKGASGNVATEDVVYMLHGLGIKTGIDLTKLLAAGEFISRFLQREPQSKLGRNISHKGRGSTPSECVVSTGRGW